jgi:putative hydrolase of the HAD superfamily
MSDRDRTPVAVIVCDLDDTLYLERDFVASGFRSLDAHVAQRFGFDGFSAAAWPLFVQGSRNDIFDQILIARGCRYGQEDIAEMVDRYRGHEPTIALASDAARLLERVPDDVALALITDGPVPAQSGKIAALGLTPRFPTLFITDSWGIDYRKPHPHAFRSVMERYGGLSPSQFIYIGDNPKKDFVAPKHLGWWTIRIRRELGLHFDAPETEESRVDRTILSLDELLFDNLTKGLCP